MERRAFVKRFGGVYEHSPWVAEGAHACGLTAAEDTPEGLAATMAKVVARASDAAKLELIRGHPDLAGRAAIAGELTAASKSEQAGAGLDRCTPEEYERFQTLNRAYKAKFNFPFILAVSGKARGDILATFEARMGHDSDAELRTALAEIDKIALIRLQAMAG
jgi:OHCU decarboxylase